MEGKLNAKKVESLKTPGRYGDGRGLYLQVQSGVEGPTKSWSLRIKMGGRPRQMGLGPYPEFSLADARQRAQEARRAFLSGGDPIEAKRAAKLARAAAQAKARTFAECAAD